MDSATKSNPLAGFMRQPKIYIKLPSGGQFWPEGSLVPSENGQYPVYSMTAKDELMIKIPDALMSGQAVVDVIQNCMPNIKNAWMAPTIDIDAILIAIRLATYGEMMNTPLTFGADIEMEYQVDLRLVLDNLMSSITWNPIIPINDNLTIFVRPLNYKQMTETASQNYETQKIMQVVNDDRIDEDHKLKLFKESFDKLTNSTLGMISNSVYKVESSNGSTDDPEYIKEFLENIDKEIFQKIEAHLTALKDLNTIKPIQVPVTEEMAEQGITGSVVEVPLIFDASSFFG